MNIKDVHPFEVNAEEPYCQTCGLPRANWRHSRRTALTLTAKTTHQIIIELDSDDDAVADAVDILERMFPFLADNVVVTSRRVLG